MPPAHHHAIISLRRISHSSAARRERSQAQQSFSKHWNLKQHGAESKGAAWLALPVALWVACVVCCAALPLTAMLFSSAIDATQTGSRIAHDTDC